MGAGDEFFLVVIEGLGASPLLVELAALVGLTNLVVAKAELLLGLLGKVVGVGDALVLGLGGLGGLVLGTSFVALSDGLASLLVLQLGVALVGAPALSSLLRRGTGTPLVQKPFAVLERIVKLYLLTSGAGVAIILVAGTARATACDELSARYFICRRCW